MKPVFKTCEQCSKAYLRRGPFSRFCAPCAEERKRVRQLEWARAHPSYDPARGREERQAIRAKLDEVGIERSLATPGLQVAAHASTGRDFAWWVWVRIPFSYAWSKNAVWRVGKGHVYMRPAVKQRRAELAEQVKRAVVGAPLVKAKVWISIHVQKPNHKGDAVNFVDFVCDSVKDGLGLDDRWFSINSVDWEVVKRNPKISIGFGQTATEEERICSVCGRSQAVGAFKSRTGKECKACYASAREKLRAEAT